MPLCAIINNTGRTCNVFVQGPVSQYRALSVSANQVRLLQASQGRKALLAFSSSSQFLIAMRPIDVPGGGAIFPIFRSAPVQAGGETEARLYGSEVDSGEGTFQGQTAIEVINQAVASGQGAMIETELEEIGH